MMGGTCGGAVDQGAKVGINSACNGDCHAILIHHAHVGGPVVVWH